MSEVEISTSVETLSVRTLAMVMGKRLHCTVGVMAAWQ